MSTNHFDERAATWDEPAHIERAARVAACIRAAVPLDRSMRMLEYGAGTGLVTQALRGDVGPVTLADASSGMRAVIARKLADGDIADGRLWDVDLSTDAPPDDELDLVVTVLALHHIVDVDAVLAGFAALLADGGTLCVVDLEAGDGSFHGHGFEGHDGFERSALTSQLEAAGFTDVRFTACGDVVRDTGTYPMFLAVATR